MAENKVYTKKEIDDKLISIREELIGNIRNTIYIKMNADETVPENAQLILNVTNVE